MKFHRNNLWVELMFHWLFVCWRWTYGWGFPVWVRLWTVLNGIPYVWRLPLWSRLISNQALHNAMISSFYTTELRYWSVEDDEEMSNIPYWYRKDATAMAIETTAYGLLTQLTLDELSYSHNIVEWLIHQRKATGAFLSTQVRNVYQTVLITFCFIFFHHTFHSAVMLNTVRFNIAFLPIFTQ